MVRQVPLVPQGQWAKMESKAIKAMLVLPDPGVHLE